MRPIDADALKLDLSRFYESEVTAKELIDEQPTIGGDLISRKAALNALAHVELITITKTQDTESPYSASGGVTAIDIHVDTETVKRAIEAVPAAFDKDNVVRSKNPIRKSPAHGDPFCLVIIAAVRYCLGRRTYMPDVVTRWIMARVPELPAETAKIMLRDINDQRRQYGLGDDCDVKTWETFESWLQGRLCE